MTLKKLFLTDFRSYSDLTWSPDSDVNILVGENGAGKTNLLEAAAYLGSLKSFRGSPEEALVATAAQSAIVRGEIERPGGPALIEVEIHKQGGRRARLDRKALPRATDLFSVFRAVTFLPDDLDLVKGGPGRRRDLLDQVATQLWPAASGDQMEFERALRQRNTFLRQGDRDSGTLDVWDARLSQAAARLMGRRSRAARALEEWLAEMYDRIAGEGVAVGFDYQSEWGGSLDPTMPAAEWTSALSAALQARRRLDFELRNTGAGPHRDDPALSLRGRSARFQASQGEQRTLALSLRLASHRAVTAQIGETPLLLLDDVYSELDPGRAKALTDALPAAQTIITTTRPEEVPIAGRAWRVREGTVT